MSDELMKRPTITVFGSSSVADGSDAFRTAYQLGRTLAIAGFDLANGGYGGTMLASARGAVECGAAVTGVTCSAFGRDGPNRYITRRIETASLYERLTTLIRLGEAYVVLPGSTGTLLELAMIWESANKGFLPLNKPVILLGEFWLDLVDLVATMDPKSAGVLYPATDPASVERILKERLKCGKVS